MGASGLGQLLVEEGLIQEFDRRTIRRTSGNQSCAFAKGIIALGLFDEDQLAGFLTEFTKFDRVPRDFSEIVDINTFSSIDPNLITRLEAVPLMLDGRYLTVALADPLDHATIRQLEFFTGYKIRPMIATIQQIVSTIQKLIPSFQPEPTPLQRFLTNHVDAAAYHRRVKDMSDPDIRFDTPQASDTVNFGAPRSDDNEFEELTLDDDFTIEDDGSSDETDLDLSGLGGIDGDEEEDEASLMDDMIADDESDVGSMLDDNSPDDGTALAADDFGLDDTTSDTAAVDDLGLFGDEDDGVPAPEEPNAVAAMDDLGLFDEPSSTTEAAAEIAEEDSDNDTNPALDDLGLFDEPADTRNELSMSTAEPDNNSLDDVLEQSAVGTDIISNDNADDDLQASDDLLDQLGSSDDTETAEDVANLVAQTMFSSDDQEPENELTAATPAAGPATADDLGDILNSIPQENDESDMYDEADINDEAEMVDEVDFDMTDETNFDRHDTEFEIPIANEPLAAATPTLANLHAMADSAIADLNRAMISLNASTSKEDLCQVFARAIGSNFPTGALLIDQGGAIEPVCAWSERGQTLTWDGFGIAETNVLALAQLAPGSWSQQAITGLPSGDNSEYIVHVLAIDARRLYMVGQPSTEVNDAMRRHVGRMLKAIIKRL